MKRFFQKETAPYIVYFLVGAVILFALAAIIAYPDALYWTL